MNTLRKRLTRIIELYHLLVAAGKVARASRPGAGTQPVIFFNASTRLSGLSQNAGFSLLASWMIRLSGVPVVHFVCKAGMLRCVLGTDENDISRPMPCGMCTRQSRVSFSFSQKQWFDFDPDVDLAEKLEELNLNQLLAFEILTPFSAEKIPLGSLVLPSLRWRMRLHSLVDDANTRTLCREFMLSAWNIVSQFGEFLAHVNPRAVVLFNGTHFPEAVVAWICRQRRIRVITHESGFQPFSGYFVEGEATTYPITIPGMDLTSIQNARLDADMQKRWQGDFSMAGVKFFPGMQGLPVPLQEKTRECKQVVSIFTNVIFDTTQMYANTVFSSMFAWLDELLPIISAHPDTLFILRAHPDESRSGKASRENVGMWFEKNAASLQNIQFIPPSEQVSSYDLVRVSKFALTYNSTIGLESILLGVPVLAAGQSPFNAFDTVFFEQDRAAYFRRLAGWLSGGNISLPPERLLNTRRFLYYRTYRYSLPFDEFLDSTSPVGYVRLKKFSLSGLMNSRTTRAVREGVLDGKRFEIDV